jgi:drug/metabolite transporter (DMT)-like permease
MVAQSADAAPAGLSLRTRSILYVLAAMVLFAAYDALSKHLAAKYQVTELLWVRYLTHASLMLVVFGPKMGLRLVKTSQPVAQILRALLLVAVTFLFMSGLKYIRLAEATAINFLAPLLVTALSAPLLKERVSARSWIAVLFGFVGVLLIVRPSTEMNIAMLFPLGSAVCYSLYQIMTRRFVGAEHPLTTHFILGSVGLVVTTFTWQPSWVLPAYGDLPLMIGLGLTTGTGHFLLIKAFEHISPASAAPFTYTHLIWAVLLGLLVFGEIPSVLSVLGIVTIGASGLFNAFAGRGRRST